MSMQFPTKHVDGLLLGFGRESEETLRFFNVSLLGSKISRSFRSVLNLPPKMYILLSWLAEL